MNSFASDLIVGGNVAENNNVWRFFGSVAMIFFSAGRKPMSSMRSASSSTSVSTADRSSVRCCMWSIRRPGVAMTTSTPRRKALICGPMLTPPKMVVALMCTCLP